MSIFQTCPDPRSLDPANLSSTSCIPCPRCSQMGQTIADTQWALWGRWLLLSVHVKCPIRPKSLFIISLRPSPAATMCMTPDTKRRRSDLNGSKKAKRRGLFPCVWCTAALTRGEEIWSLLEDWNRVVFHGSISSDSQCKRQGRP